MAHYTILTAAAKMPSRFVGRYRRVAIMSHESPTPPKTIRDTKTAKIVWLRDRLHAVGQNTAFARALAEAAEIKAKLESDR